MSGRGMARDQNRALTLYDKACKGGDTRACQKVRFRGKSE
jgi:TPR repeat protein